MAISINWVGPKSTGTIGDSGKSFRLLTYQLPNGEGPMNGPQHLQDAKDGFTAALKYADDKNVTSNPGQTLSIPYPDGESVYFGYHDLSTGNSAWVYGFFGLKNSNGTFSNHCQAAWLDGNGNLQSNTDVPDIFTFTMQDIEHLAVVAAFNANGNGGCSFSFDFNHTVHSTLLTQRTRPDAEPAVAPDRGGIAVFYASTSRHCRGR